MLSAKYRLLVATISFQLSLHSLVLNVTCNCAGSSANTSNMHSMSTVPARLSDSPELDVSTDTSNSAVASHQHAVIHQQHNPRDTTCIQRSFHYLLIIDCPARQQSPANIITNTIIDVVEPRFFCSSLPICVLEYHARSFLLSMLCLFITLRSNPFCCLLSICRMVCIVLFIR